MKATTEHLITYGDGVPSWPEAYITYFEDLNDAGPPQWEFYRIFKEAFEEGTFYDLEGNNNYAFILLQDIRRAHGYKQMQSFETQIQILSLHYPAVRLHALSLLIYRMKRTFNVKGMNRIRNQEQKEYKMYAGDNKEQVKDFWLLGSRYKGILELTAKQASVLDKVLHRINHFNSIEFCLIQAIKLFCSALDELDKLFQKKKKTVAEVIAELVEGMVKKRKILFPYDNASAEDTAIMMEIELYTILFDHCENTVRRKYKYRYHLDVDLTVNVVEVLESYEKKLGSKYEPVLDGLAAAIPPPDTAADSELCRQSPAYLKSQLKELLKAYKQSPADHVKRIFELGKTVRSSPMVKEFYHSAFLFAVNKDKKTALSFYLYYAWHDLNSGNPENRVIEADLQGKLFKKEGESEEFNTILVSLRQNNDIKEAFQALENMLAFKRRKIELDSEAIETIRHQHVDTVDILGRYLEEDSANLDITADGKGKSSQTKQPEKSKQSSIYLTSLKLNPLQEELLAFFSARRFSAAIPEVEEFCRRKAVFPGQLVESINEACFELLDDLLIEQDDQQYKIEPRYYNMILQSQS